MKTEMVLSELYQQYIDGNLSKQEIDGGIFRYLLDNHERYRVFEGNRDRWDEFLSWLYPRLSRAVELYRNMGSSFDAYITGIVQAASKEYRTREADHKITEYACWQARAEELLLHEAESDYLDHPKHFVIPSDIKPRQLLLLLLKSYFYASDDLVNQVSSAIGMKPEEIRSLVEELRKRRAEKEAEILSLRERVHCQYYRCLAYQRRMFTAQPGTEYHDKMKDRFKRAKQRFLTMKKRLMGMRMDASNRMIAEVMGIPKGTVDSGLFAVKNRQAQIESLRAEPIT